MTRPLLLLLAMATTASTAPRACSGDLDDDEPTPSATPAEDGSSRGAEPTGGSPKITGPAGNGQSSGAVTVDVPEKWRSAASALGTVDGAAEAVATFTKAGAEVCPILRSVALEDGDMSRRGRAIQALTGIEDACADDALLELERVRTLPLLIRTWAAAGRVARASTIEDLTSLAALTGEFPALARPVSLRAESLLGPEVPADQLLELATDASTLSGAVLPLLRARPTEELLAVQFSHEKDPVRRQAAAYLGTFVGEDGGRAKAVIDSYAHPKGTTKVLWDAGALYVPAARWDKDQARALYRNLLSWQIFCQEAGLDGELRQVTNNLRSVGIWRTAGYARHHPDTFAAVAAYGADEGQAALTALLAEHDLQDDPRYRKAQKVTR